MIEECVCDSSSECTEEKNEGSKTEFFHCNRIFLNFSREFRPSPEEGFKIAKVKDLFKYLSERQDLQEMKVSGWFDEGKQPKDFEEDLKDEEETEEEFDKCALESCGRSSDSTRSGGQRFAMSRDFWYRKLNTLKAQKLDEVALEAKDLPPDNRRKETKPFKWSDSENVFSSELPENWKDIVKEINLFDKSVAKPVEKQLKKQFVNVYDNRKYFTKKCD